MAYLQYASLIQLSQLLKLDLKLSKSDSMAERAARVAVVERNAEALEGVRGDIIGGRCWRTRLKCR